jgi:hypothetical protein
MTFDEQNFPIKELQESIKRYTEIKLKTDLCQKTLHDEAENLFLYFVKYAKNEHNGKPNSFSALTDNFYLDVLGMSCDSQDKAVRASLTRRFKKLMKKHIIDDSKYQVKLDEFLLRSDYRQREISSHQ